uniref:SET domain-containing protein n=1 Tax=Trypanosoma vivax (strain Y486) TaxID=1055687 RepID=G0U1P4_TRYVY|nr:conserved hypothetical protein, fragment [Trypanosoma vivax Y486]
MSGGLRVCYVGEQHGDASFATRPLRAGEVVLQEWPVVFSQALRQGQGEPPICCAGCGTILASLREECFRLTSLVPESASGMQQLGERSEMGAVYSAHALYEMMKGFDSPEHFNPGITFEDSASGSPDCVRFCGVKCRDRCVHDHGGRFLLPLLGSLQQRVHSKAKEEENGEFEDVHRLLRRPSAETIMCHATSLDAGRMCGAWPCKDDVLETLRFLVESYNARLLLVMRILARCLGDTVNAGDVGSRQQLLERFTTTVHDFVSRYAEGSPRSLSLEQRAFLRFSWKCVCRWLYLCSVEEGRVAEGDKSVTRQCKEDNNSMDSLAWFPLQLYLRCYWLTDANAHMYVVVSPLYTLFCRQLATLHSICVAGRVSAALGRDELGGTRDPSDEAHLRGHMLVLHELFRAVDPNLAHATGVALYDAASKINHSCAPSVRFMPTHGGVQARVVRDIADGEEVRTSYIEVGAHDSREARRGYLLRHYGFNCDCPLCECE